MERYRIRDDAAVYFVTYSVVEWLPVFVTPASCGIISESLQFCHREKNLRVSGYVIMPTHIHLIAFDADFNAGRLDQSLSEFRRYTGRRLSDYCTEHAPACFAQTLRDRTIYDRERRFWQPSRHPEAIATEWFWRQKLDYLHDNPCRKQLVRRPEPWRYSSAAWYASDGQELVDVPITAIMW